MGLFSTKKITHVSTVTYPLGTDDLDERVDFLKYTLLNTVLQGRSIGEAIPRAYLTGQGLKLRNAYRYARDHYHMGLPDTGFFYNATPDRDALHDVLVARHPGKDIAFLHVLVTFADYTWWAERFLAQTYGYDRTTKLFDYPPSGIDANAAVSYDIDGPSINILLMNDNGFSKLVTFRPADLTSRVIHVHAAYQTIEAFPEEVFKTTRPATPGEVDDFELSTVTVNRASELQETTTTIITTIAGGTATVTTKKRVRLMSRPQYFLYRLGAGTYPTLDAWQQTGAEASPYYPSVPLRLNNNHIATVVGGDAAWEVHPLNKTGTKLLKKVGIGYADMLEKLEDNENLGDIDFCFLVFGVSLNTKSPEGKKYLYRFFEHMHEQQLYTKAEFDTWAADQEQIGRPYLRQAPDAAHCTLTSPLVRVAEDEADVNLTQEFIV